MIDAPADLIAHVRELRAGRGDRLAAYLAAVREFTRPYLNPENASWRNLELTTESSRLNFQLSVAYLHGDDADIDMANKLLVRSMPKDCGGFRFGVFETSYACQFLYDFADKLTPANVELLRTKIVEGCDHRPGFRQPDYQFHGYNDNMPAMGTKTLVLGGELLGRDDLLAHGIWQLQRWAAMLTAYGMVSEYNSLNYTADTLLNAACIAHHTRDERSRELALKIARRMWSEIATHWHPGAHALAGPHARADDSGRCNHMFAVKAVLYFEFGEEVSGFNAVECVHPRPGLQLVHCGDPFEHGVRMAWFGVGHTDGLDDAVATRLLRQPEEALTIATSYQGDSAVGPKTSRVAGPRSESVHTTFITPAYSLGTSSEAFLNGVQSNPLVITGAAPGEDIGPFAWAAMLLNDEQPGQVVRNNWHYTTIGETTPNGQGWTVGVQQRNSSLLSVVPRADLADDDVECLRLGLIMPTAQHDLDEFLPPAADDPTRWLGLRLGQALVALRPLIGNVRGDEFPASVRLQRCASHAWLEMVNYEGPARRFPAAELALFLNGFAVEVAATGDWKSLAAFVAAVAGASAFEDCYLARVRRLRYHRTALADRDAVTLEIGHSTYAKGPATRLINGRRAPAPTWESNVVPAAEQPFLGDDGVIAPIGLPWTDLTVRAWPDEPWGIFANDSDLAARCQS